MQQQKFIGTSSRGGGRRANHYSRGVSLLDAVVGTALLLVVFLGIAAAFLLSVDVVSSNKARSGAIAIAGERMEYIRSIAYGSIGTVGGIPAGLIAQSETQVMNGVTYTLRTVVEYVDDPMDGLGAADTNGIVSDYKIAKVDAAWPARSGTRHITIVSRFQPPSGMELSCTPPCGNLVVNAVNASSVPLSNASVSIINASTSPATNINTFTNASGSATIIGAPAASGYAIVVTKSGYSTARTYSVSASNTNPNPGNLTVANGQTTVGTFGIDLLGTKTVRTWTQVLSDTWTETFANSNTIATSTAIEISGGEASLAGGAGAYAATGDFQSTPIGPDRLYRWGTFTSLDTRPVSTEIRYSFYDGTGTVLIPDAVIPGNNAGLATSTVDLSTVSTTTYPTIHVHAILTSSDVNSTPSINSYAIQYEHGPDPLPNIAFVMQGQKTIGIGPSGTVYKYTYSFNTGASAAVAIPNLEWDVYAVSVDGDVTGYDIVSSCPDPQPETFVPGAIATTDLFLAAHTANSLLVNVRSAGTGALIPNATVHLGLSPSYSATSTADSCGQVFFGGLSSSASYLLWVGAMGYQTATSTVNINGTSLRAVTLN